MRWRWTHPTVAFLASIFLIWLLVRAARRVRDWDNRGLSALVLMLLAAQYVLGVLDVVLLAPVWLQIAHLLGADALWAALVVLTAGLPCNLSLQPAGPCGLTITCALSTSPAHLPPDRSVPFDGRLNHRQLRRRGQPLDLAVRRITVSSALPPRMLGFQAKA